jgi:hypothetical protein
MFTRSPAASVRQPDLPEQGDRSLSSRSGPRTGSSSRPQPGPRQILTRTGFDTAFHGPCTSAVLGVRLHTEMAVG